jgi:PKD repeat protein
MVAIPSDAAVGDVQIDLSGTGVESAAATVAPSMLDFGEWPVNTSFALVRNFVLVNSGESNVSFTDIRLEGAQAGEFLFPDPPDTSDLAPGEVRSVAVAFDPTSDGMKVADVAVEMMAGGNPISAQVALSGTGGGPLSPIGLTTAEIVRELLGQNTVDLDVDVNADADEDAADVVTNENAIGE